MTERDVSLRTDASRGIPTAEELWGDSFRAAMDATAPPCPECGVAALKAEAMPEVRRDFHEHGTGDMVTWAMEVYRCGACQMRILKRIELDRETAEEIDREQDNAVARARMRDEAPFLLSLFNPNAWEREVQRAYPRRPDPDLMERWRDRR